MRSLPPLTYNARQGIISKFTNAAAQEFALGLYVPAFFPAHLELQWACYSSAGGLGDIFCSVEDENGLDVDYKIDTWYHIIALYDMPNNLQLLQVNHGSRYSDSFSGGTHHGGATARPAELFVIGSHDQTASSYFDGVIDEVGFWKRLLNPTECEALYNKGFGKMYPFDYETNPWIPIAIYETVVVQSPMFTETVPTPPNVLLEKLVAYWTMEEDSGTVYDAYSINHLTDTLGVGTTAGFIDKARHWPGHYAYASRIAGDALATGDEDFTYSAWVKLDAYKTTEGNTTASVLGLKDIDDNGQWLGLYDYPSDRFAFIYMGWICAVVGKPLLGIWYHLVCWYDSATRQTHLSVNNGTPADRVIPIDEVIERNPNGPFVIGYGGRDGNYTDFWHGAIDEVGFWKRVLTPDERTLLYHGGLGFPLPFGATIPSLLQIEQADTVPFVEGVIRRARLTLFIEVVEM